MFLYKFAPRISYERYFFKKANLKIEKSTFKWKQRFINFTPLSFMIKKFMLALTSIIKINEENTQVTRKIY